MQKDQKEILVWKNFIINSKVTEIDPKTKLQEFSLKKFKKLPMYKTIKKIGPNHNPFFQVRHVWAQGSRNNKYLKMIACISFIKYSLKWGLKLY